MKEQGPAALRLEQVGKWYPGGVHAVQGVDLQAPRLFLMDEPLSNLDAKLRVQMRREITTLQRQLGTTTIYVTHDQTEAMTMGDRIAIFHQGVLQQADTPQMVYDYPANQFVAQFIGSPPMNLWEQDGMVLGVRPEHLRWTQEPRGLAAEVHTVERTGRETFIFGRAERIGDFAMVLGQACNLEPHSRGWLTISAAHVHRFHKETGKRLNDPAGSSR